MLTIHLAEFWQYIWRSFDNTFGGIEMIFFVLYIACACRLHSVMYIHCFH